MLKRVIIIFLLVSVFFNEAKTQNINRAGTSAAQFLKFGAGARANAMGEAGVALAEDISGLYWNPAGIARIGKKSIMVSRNQLYADLFSNFFGFAFPITKNSALGISGVFLNSEQMEITTLEEPQGTGNYFSWESMYVAVSYSRFVTDRLSLGATVKYIREGAYNQKAHAVAIDIGSLLDTGVLGMKLGMSLCNLGTDMQLSGSSLGINHDWYTNHSGSISSPANLETGKWHLPLIFRLGLSTELIGVNGQLIKNEGYKVIIAADTFDPNDALLRSNFGLEYEWNNIFALRCGYRGVSLEKDEYESYITSSFTLGAGMKYKFDFANTQIDYSFVDYKILGSGHQFSLILSF
ncbi:PorV/PorQ family protein [candidate division KSB1 bacterium]|nr:PorV/PorQ family protein [candidate division KSB1 bacterium]MBL7093599.1 PorV/PorQ family protein [candidate division KSB1 bacterium]